MQPRIRLLRSFDERHHNYLGYALRLDGTLAGTAREFSVGIGKAAQAKLALRVGDKLSGVAQPVADARLETVELYKASALKLIARATPAPAQPPPWHDLPPPLEVYRQRGHRRLDPRTYAGRCRTCIWGAQMPVEMIIDHWKPDIREYRVETFCYGPTSCSAYRAGATRKVPGRNNMVWEEEDWVDEEATAGRSGDE